MTPVLITGAEGYLGGRIVHRMNEYGVPAFGTARKSDTFIDCDLLDFDAVSCLKKKTRSTTVIHCAARVPKTRMGYMDYKFGLTDGCMIENIIGAGFHHIIYLSSMTVYGEEAPMPVKEEDVSKKLMGYSSAKRSGELKLLGMKAPQKATILRLPGLFGAPRRSGLLYAVIKAICMKNDFRLDQDLPLWAAMHVDDAAEICCKVALGTLPKYSTIFNVGYPEAMSIPRAIRTISKMTSHRIDDLPPGKEFQMNVEKLKHCFGLPSYGFHERVREFIDWVERDCKQISQSEGKVADA